MNMHRIPSADEEIDLLHVENEAAKVLLSPTIWVKRPVPRFDGRTVKERGIDADNSEKIERMENAPQGSLALEPSLFKRSGYHSHHHHSHSREAPTPISSGQRHVPDPRESADKILEGLETEDKENQHAKTDIEEIKAIENEVALAERNKKLLLDQLQSSRTELSSLRSENESVKRIFASLGVVKSDFDMEGAADGPGRKKRMVSIGRRLVENLNNKQLFPQNNLQTKLPAIEQSGQLMAIDEANKANKANKAKEETLPIMKTPNIPQNLKGASTLPVFTPPSSFPEESQIAAAALTVAKGDPAVAMLSLLEKALASRAPPLRSS
jgi:hypothetical protein